MSHRAAASASSSRSATAARTADTSADSSGVRAGPSPSQNGIVEGAPPASSTRTFPLSTRRIRQELLPSRITSPAIDSIAKSSSSVPIGVSSGSSTTW
jgi:hypothetical protein